jgi:uncharacterized tellurite resistance protein B-like protein
VDSTTQLSLGDLDIPKLEAVVELMFLAAYADGHVSDVERQVFKDHIEASSRGQLQPKTIDNMLSFIERSLEHEGRENRLDAIRKRIPDRMRVPALDLAIRVMRADEVVHPSESGFLLRAAQALAIEPSAALERLRVSYTELK